MNNRFVAIILAAFFTVLGLWMTEKAISIKKKKGRTSRVLFCIGGLGSFAAGGYCVMAARKF